MEKIEHVKSLLGKLVKQTRATNMDQHELALRTSTSKNTISRLELGKSVNVDTVLTVLEHLDLLAPVLETIEQQYHLVKQNPQRNSQRNNQRSTAKSADELPNDF